MNNIDTKAIYLFILLGTWVALDFLGIKDTELLSMLKYLIGGIGIYAYHVNVTGSGK